MDSITNRVKMIGDKMNKKNELVVYWANFGLLDRLQRTNLFVEPPVRIMQTFHKEINYDSASVSYKSCTAAKNLFQNTFVIKSPFDVNAKIIDNVVYEKNQLVSLRKPTYENIHSIEYDFSWIFFSEESVEIVQTPPYMHNTSISKYGIVPSGSFDISKWLRPINATLHLHKDVDEFKINKDEPLFYLDFKTKKKVVLKQFDLTLDLHNLANASGELKQFFPFEPLETLYNRFTRSNRHKKVMQEIRKNLLD
jgi:hypothetical protein